MEPILVLPSEKYKASFLEALAEQPEGQKFSRLEGNNEFNAYAGDFDLFLKNLEKEREGKDLPENWIQQTVYWLVEGDMFIGRVAIRHRLNDHLMKYGGHIGYSIRPSQWHKGYGTLILKQALEKTRELGIEKALLTCFKTNTASRRIIEKNGGVYENEVVGNEGVPTLRFWIDLSV